MNGLSLSTNKLRVRAYLVGTTPSDAARRRLGVYKQFKRKKNERNGFNVCIINQQASTLFNSQNVENKNRLNKP
ncbi:hypothetical protein BpHYR1_027674 [Brachionus plicatilis]|uniref:Uncharacterized protein n=1 Tax=Brachionus plicatilis TaxID=10195 RepID=A0A3M7QDZ9_BRAPC|nr:hypothetical protein BpHYR1_027674 [Brachionus plicatilis]